MNKDNEKQPAAIAQLEEMSNNYMGFMPAGEHIDALIAMMDAANLECIWPKQMKSYLAVMAFFNQMREAQIEQPDKHITCTLKAA